MSGTGMSGMGEEAMELLRVRLRLEQDIFVVRQRGREVAAAVGLERQDQIRLATVLSEVGREMLRRATTATVVFSRVEGVEPVLRVEAETIGQGATDAREAVMAALAPAARLVDELRVDGTAERLQVVVVRRLPGTGPVPGAEALRKLRERLATLAPSQPIDELIEQNAQLVETLTEVQRQRDELLRLNSELEETNRGVMALYHQLSGELEETNRGVVALYAELEERSAQLREANEAKSRFLANVSHELRAPVTAVIGLARLLSGPGSAPLVAEQREQVALIQSSATDLLGLVNELLDLAKAESGRLVPAWEVVRLGDVFAQLRGVLRGLVDQAEVDFIVEEPPPLPGFVTDQTLLTQILRNLVANALRFTGRGHVRVVAQRTAMTDNDPDGLEILVSDTGPGIERDQHDRIFEEFYQVPGVRPAGRPGSRGTGLGLPYARRLARLLGGDLTVTSEPGRGSTFRVWLPVLAEPPDGDGAAEGG